jgi:hypothetical protein
MAYRINGGADVLMSRLYYSDGATAQYLNESVTLQLAAGDYVEVRAYGDAGGTSTSYAAQLARLDSGSASGTGTPATNAAALIYAYSTFR